MRAGERISRPLLAVAGVLLAFVILECSLQLASAVARRRPVQISRADPTDAFRILFIGESTTASLHGDVSESWPRMVEAKLKHHFGTDRIQIANRAVVGVDSTYIRDHIDQWLDETRPHLVVSMLGINDDLNVLVYETRNLQGRRWRDRFRTYRLVAMLWRSVAAEQWPGRTDFLHGPGRRSLAAVRAERLADLHTAKDELLKAGQYTPVLPLLRDLVDEDAGTPVYHLGLQKDILTGYEGDHEISRACMALGLGAEDCPGEWIDMRPHLPAFDETEAAIDPWLLLRLHTTVAERTGDREAEIRLLETAQDHEEIGLYAKMRTAHFHYRRDEFAEGDAVVRRLARKVTRQDDDWLLDTLEFFLLYSQRYELAIEVSRRERPSPEIHATRSRLYLIRREGMARFMAGEDAEAGRVFAEERRLQLAFMNAMTASNYRDIASRVAAHGSLLAVVQYPTLSVDPLFAMLEGLPVFAFIENRGLFLSAARERGYFTIFSDIFAGSFGHLTTEGNELVAESVFQQLLRAGLRVRASDFAPEDSGQSGEGATRQEPSGRRITSSGV